MKEVRYKGKYTRFIYRLISVIFNGSRTTIINM